MSFRILSLDGGGIRGVISAKILEEVERQIREIKGQSLDQYFDMVAGTSTGSILTAGIASKKTAKQLIEIYQKTGEVIFPYKKSKFPGILQSLISMVSPPKYTHEGLIKCLRSELGEVKIKEIESPIILIPAYDMQYRNTTFFTNCHPDVGDRWYDDTPLWEICVCSSSAPTYFPAYELRPYNTEKFGNWSFPHIDGGVSANNPALAAISQVIKISQSKSVAPEVKQKYKLDNLTLDDISVLSIGTGQTGEPFEYQDLKNWKTLDLMSHVVDVFMEPTSEIASTICRQIIGGFESSRYLRLQFDLNERFKPKTNETYKDTRELVKAENRTNRFLKDEKGNNVKVSEQIDDARKEIIDQLIGAAEGFIKEGCTYYTRDNCGPKVTNAIASFINSN
jgi:patatin-like phospholipase/acyl hydrolase